MQLLQGIVSGSALLVTVVLAVWSGRYLVRYGADKVRSADDHKTISNLRSQVDSLEEWQKTLESKLDRERLEHELEIKELNSKITVLQEKVTTYETMMQDANSRVADAERRLRETEQAAGRYAVALERYIQRHGLMEGMETILTAGNARLHETKGIVATELLAAQLAARRTAGRDIHANNIETKTLQVKDGGGSEE